MKKSRSLKKREQLSYSQRATRWETIHAGEVAKLLRNTFCNDLLQMAKDRSRFGQLFNEIKKKVIPSDLKHLHGRRNVLGGDLRMLEGFEFDRYNPLSEIFTAPYYAHVYTAVCGMALYIPSFETQCVVAPKEATHFQLMWAGAVVDFRFKEAYGKMVCSGIFSLKRKISPDLTLVMQLKPAKAHYIQALGIRFFRKDVSLNGGVCTAVKIVKIELPGTDHLNPDINSLF